MSADPDWEFNTWIWRAYRWLFRPPWERRGTFEGSYVLRWVSPRTYHYEPDPDDPFRFLTADKILILPRKMRTDLGSVPRWAWSLGIAPDEFPGPFILHDWLWINHHCAPSNWTFEETNRLLGEAIYTLMMDRVVPADPWKVAAVYRAVSSRVARRIWETPWTASECNMALT